LELKGEFGQFGAMSPDQSALRPAKYPASGRGPYLGYDGLNVDGYAWADLVQWIVESYQHGSINTISWHETNPLTYGGYNSNLYYPGTWMNHSTVPPNMNQTAAYYVLPGGELHNRYEARMDAIVEFNEDITEANGGTAVPTLFRPYHEHSGDWFWWGIDDMERKFQPTTYQQYADLFKMLEDYLMDHGVHNFLYEISPDRSRLGEPSVLFEDLTGNAELKALLDKYIDTKGGQETCIDWGGFPFCWSTGWSDAVKEQAHIDLQAQYVEAQSLTPASFHYGEPIALNNSGVPLDLDAASGEQTTANAEFRDWIDSGTWKQFLLQKWEQGFPGAEYVDVYGIDNYWESGGTGGHQYHPYNGQADKIVELFCSSFDYVAEKARADKKLVAMTEGSSAIQEIHDRFASECNTGTAPYTLGDGDGDTYPNLKYVSYALTWQGGQSGSGNANPVTGDYADEIAMAGEWEFYETPLYYQQSGDIDVDVEIPAFAGGLAVGFSSASVSLADAALSSDKAWIVGAGDLPAIEIEDSRPGASVGWDSTITAGAQLTGPDAVDGKALGISPEVLTQADNQTVTPGASVAAWTAGFTAGTELGSSPAGSSRGIATLGGELSYKLPATVTPGAYQGVLSVTVL
jgi:hypothetical protein